MVPTKWRSTIFFKKSQPEKKARHRAEKINAMPGAESVFVVQKRTVGGQIGQLVGDCVLSLTIRVTAGEGL